MKSKKKSGCLKTVLIVIGVFIVLGIISSIFADDNPTQTPTKVEEDDKNQGLSEVKETKENKGEESKTKEDNVVKSEPFETVLSAGHYTAGIDFPSGVYHIVAESGSGNVSSSNMFSGGMNETMSTTKDEMYITEFKNAKLNQDVVLSVSGNLKIKISTDTADMASLVPRKNDLTEEIELSSGNYVAGTDFTAGIYDIILVEGNGNVSSSNMFEGGLNAVMGSDDDMYTQEFKNATLEEGTTLELSGITIKLVPSK